MKVMLKPKPLTQILSQANTGGVTATLLFSKDGRLLAYAGETDPHPIAALASGIWTSYNSYGRSVLSSNKLSSVLIQLDGGSVIVKLVSDVLLCLFARGVINAGVIRLKAKTLSDNLEDSLSQLTLL